MKTLHYSIIITISIALVLSSIFVLTKDSTTSTYSVTAGYTTKPILQYVPTSGVTSYYQIKKINDIVPKIQSPSQTKTTYQYMPNVLNYGASSSYSPTTDTVKITVQSSSSPFTYNVIIKNYIGTVTQNYTTTVNSLVDEHTFNLAETCKPAEVHVLIPGVGLIYSIYDGTFEQEQACQK